METEQIFSEPLNLGTDWEIKSVNYGEYLTSVEIHINYVKDKGFCSKTGVGNICHCGNLKLLL